METSSVKLLKQSGFSEPPTEKIRNHPQRYPSQYDESSVRTDITEVDIMNYVKRVAQKVDEKSGNYCQNKLCDNDETVEDCPQNECYKNYLDPNYLNSQKIDPSKKVFFDSLRDVITSKSTASYQAEPDSYVVARDRIDELLQNKQPRCDYNMIETPVLDDKKTNNNGMCSNANPNGCDQVYPNVDCGNRECYKKYLADEIVMKPSEEKNKMKVSFDVPEVASPRVIASPIGKDYQPLKVAQKSDFQKKYNTLVVNSDIAVPEFVDVLVVVSEKPIKIMLPHLQGPSLVSSVGNIISTSNLLIKNLSLCSHQIVTKGNNKIDTVRTSVAIESGGKKTLGAINDSWVLL